MNLQYISDNKGKTTGVFIPINDWEYLKNKYKEIDQEEKHSFEIPAWHKEIVLQRLDEYRKLGGIEKNYRKKIWFLKS